MLGAAVVPESDRVVGPLEAALEVDVLDVVGQEVQHPAALVAREFVDSPGEDLVHEQRLLAGDRMRAYDRMDGAGKLTLRLVLAVLSGVVGGVQGGQWIEQLLHRRRQRFIGGVHVRPAGVAARGRHVVDVQDARHRRLFVGRDIGVPALAVVAERVLVGVDDHQLGVAALIRRRRVDVQVSEAPSESQMLLMRHRLIAEEEHKVLHPGGVNFAHHCVVKRLRQIDTVDGRTDGRCQRLH